MALTISIKVVPQAGKTGWVIDKSGTLKCFLKSPPERGKANQELVATIAKALRITQMAVMIIAGEISRNKKVVIDAPITYEKFLDAIGIDRQTSMLKG